MISRSRADAYRRQIASVPFTSRVEQLALIHIGDGDELGVLAGEILHELNPVLYPRDRITEWECVT